MRVSAQQNFLKPRPLIGEKLALVALSSPKQKAQRETDWDGPAGKVQRQELGEDKEYVAHKMASTGLIRVPI